MKITVDVPAYQLLEGLREWGRQESRRDLGTLEAIGVALALLYPGDVLLKAIFDAARKYQQEKK